MLTWTELGRFLRPGDSVTTQRSPCLGREGQHFIKFPQILCNRNLHDSYWILMSNYYRMTPGRVCRVSHTVLLRNVFMFDNLAFPSIHRLPRSWITNTAKTQFLSNNSNPGTSSGRAEPSGHTKHCRLHFSRLIPSIRDPSERIIPKTSNARQPVICTNARQPSNLHQQ